MSLIKICGLKREEDILIVNKYLPDFVGFIINVEKSRRNIRVETLRVLSAITDKKIKKVGVFINEDISLILSLLREGVIDIAQLHGTEDEHYIQAIRGKGYDVIKSFKIDEIDKALRTSATFPLFDNSSPGSGKSYSWDALVGFPRPYFLAGGIKEENAGNAIRSLCPYVLDLSSSVETDGFKDEEKIKRIIKIVRDN